MRIEIYNSFRESEEATLLMYLNMTPTERWIKGHELSEGVKGRIKKDTFNLFLTPKSLDLLNGKL